MPYRENSYARCRERLRLLVRLFAAAQGESERDRLMRDIERLVLHMAETLATDQAEPLVEAANNDLDIGRTSFV